MGSKFFDLFDEAIALKNEEVLLNNEEIDEINDLSKEYINFFKNRNNKEITKEIVTIKQLARIMNDLCLVKNKYDIEKLELFYNTVNQAFLIKENYKPNMMTTLKKKRATEFKEALSMISSELKLHQNFLYTLQKKDKLIYNQLIEGFKIFQIKLMPLDKFLVTWRRLEYLEGGNEKECVEVMDPIFNDLRYNNFNLYCILLNRNADMSNYIKTNHSREEAFNIIKETYPILNNKYYKFSWYLDHYYNEYYDLRHKYNFLELVR